MRTFRICVTEKSGPVRAVRSTGLVSWCIAVVAKTRPVRSILKDKCRLLGVNNRRQTALDRSSFNLFAVVLEIRKIPGLTASLLTRSSLAGFKIVRVKLFDSSCAASKLRGNSVSKQRLMSSHRKNLERIATCFARNHRRMMNEAKRKPRCKKSITLDHPIAI